MIGRVRGKGRVRLVRHSSAFPIGRPRCLGVRLVRRSSSAPIGRPRRLGVRLVGRSSAAPIGRPRCLGLLVSFFSPFFLREGVAYLPVAEDELVAGQSGRLFADLGGQIERLDDGQHGRQAERRRRALIGGKSNKEKTTQQTN